MIQNLDVMALLKTKNFILMHDIMKLMTAWHMRQIKIKVKLLLR